ncbi:sulfatase-like hydrolase/transferase, partial [Candidatus Sumerlaeota bacterium]|nr:sulfatase-like hydrolase/transferase [Candidatus Sumerlaeota bacterium]
MRAINRRAFLRLASVGATSLTILRRLGASEAPRSHPNVIFIYSDDMGFGDPSCYGNKEVLTWNIDRLAHDGTRFTEFHVASPICSPSRVAVTTGMYPARWQINDFLHERKANHEHEQMDWLDPKAPSLARTLKTAGYATAHFGKWHMGGGRDVKDAPLPSAYGFDESLVSSHPLEGMGPALDPKVPRHETTAAFVDRTTDFIRRANGRPFYVNLWPMDVHTPHVPDPERLPQFDNVPKGHRNFDAVL